ncbi:MAG: ribosome silencing factor [Pseudomonadota bacterium]|nr:ribosome silencing factor [Pseudomonadota bacterium]
MAELDISNQVVRHILETLEEGKAIDTVLLKVQKISSFTDFMIVSSGRSTRQVKSLVRRVKDCLSTKGIKPIGIEGENTGEWVLMDYGDIVLHVMQPGARDFYQLEKLWGKAGGVGKRSGEG